MKSKKKQNKKARPRNEITEQEVEAFLSAIRYFGNAGYPKLRNLRTILPSMDLYKINVILKYLERSKTIIVDNDGYIVWVRGNAPDYLTFGDVANLSEELKDFLEKKDKSKEDEEVDS